MQRLRGQRKRVYVIGAAALAIIGVGAVAVGVLIAGGGSVPETAATPAPAVSLDTSATPDSAASTSTVPIEVPALVGLPIAEAEMLLRAAGLALVRVPTPPGEAVVGTVLAQTPAAGERVPGDTVVELVYADAEAATAVVAQSVPSSGPGRGLVVCIDPGHQAQGNSAQEPVGPGASQTKPKVTGGAAGAVTRQAEHALVLTLSLKIQERLERYGVTVVMTRTIAATDISNSQRAAVANQAGADLFLRVHADSNTNADVRGVSTLYAGGNEWVAPIEQSSLKAAGMVHQQMLASTGAPDRGVALRSDLSGFNYATVPSILVEAGFLSNPVDDRQLADPAYQDKLADGIARGVLDYLGVTL